MEGGRVVGREEREGNVWGLELSGAGLFKLVVMGY